MKHFLVFSNETKICMTFYLDSPNKQVVGNSEKTLIVARLSHDTSEGRS